MNDEVSGRLLVRPNRLAAGLIMLPVLFLFLFGFHHAISIIGDPVWDPTRSFWVNVTPGVRAIIGLIILSGFFGLLLAAGIRFMLLPYIARLDAGGVRAQTMFGWREAGWDQITGVVAFRERILDSGVRFHLSSPETGWWNRKMIDIRTNLSDTPKEAVLVYAARLRPELVPEDQLPPREQWDYYCDLFAANR